MLRSRDYSLTGLVRAANGIKATQTALLLRELADLDMEARVSTVSVPFVMAQGTHDEVAPESSAQRFFDELDAPSKQVVWVEESAHMPHVEQREAFGELLTQVRVEILCRRA